MKNGKPKRRRFYRCAVPLFTFICVLSFYSAAHSTPNIAGCNIFPGDNIWNVPVDNLPVDPNSAAYITSSSGATTNLHPDFGTEWDNNGVSTPMGIPYNVVPGSQPKVPVSFDYASESDPGPYPIPPNPQIEGGSSAPSGSDRHVLVLDKDNCILYETWSSFPQNDGSWHVGSGAIFDLKSDTLRPATWTSADAAGLPILPGLVDYDEMKSGIIGHAIRFTVQHSRTSYIWPARHEAGSSSTTTYPPMGQRFRLKASYNISGFSADMQVILRALKQYGVILADNGSNWYISGTHDDRWNDNDLNTLKKLKGSDFEAVTESSLMVDPNSGKTKYTVIPALSGFGEILLPVLSSLALYFAIRRSGKRRL